MARDPQSSPGQALSPASGGHADGASPDGVTPLSSSIGQNWSPTSWKTRPAKQQPSYSDPVAVAQVVDKLHALPPLVTSWEIESLKSQLGDASHGRRFLLQGGDCVETLHGCTPDVITNKLKVLLQMSLVLSLGTKRPVIRVGRIAGQYAKPRSSPTEEREGLRLPSYFGDLVNDPEFSENAREANPRLLLDGYQHAAMTLNFIRSLIDGGFADLHHPEYWELGFIDNAKLRHEYTELAQTIAESVSFVEAMCGMSLSELTRVEFFTSHEGLHLLYESAGTRTVPRRDGHYNLTTHMPWIGERTRDPEGAHVEYFRGIRNPIGVKVGPTATGEDLIKLIEVLNPNDEPGRLTFIHRMGAEKIVDGLSPLLEAVKSAGRTVLWVSDPMHGNTKATDKGTKTRYFDDIMSELEQAFDTHKACGTILGGVHLEMTGDHVTECVGGARGLSEQDLAHNYETRCDPRLNAEQALEVAFLITQRVRQRPDLSSLL